MWRAVSLSYFPGSTERTGFRASMFGLDAIEGGRPRELSSAKVVIHVNHMELGTANESCCHDLYRSCE